MTFTLKQGERINQRQLIADLVALQYKRSGGDFFRGSFRVRGDVIEIFPAHYEDRAWRVSMFGDEIESIHEFDPLTGHKTDEFEFVKVYANSHYVTPRPTLIQAIQGIKVELRQRLEQLNAAGRLLEAQRLEQRTIYDLEMMEATGSCAGIENYSRYLTGRKPGEPPPTLFEYVPDNALVFVDEIARHHPAAWRHVPRRLPPQGDARRIRLPPAVLHGQPAAAVRGMGRHAAADHGGVGDAQLLGDRPGRRRVRRAGDPPDRLDRSAGRRAAGTHAGRRSRGRSPAGGGGGLPLAGHRADQADGRGPDRVPARAGHSCQIHALRHRHAGADRDHPRSAARRLRRAGRHQPAARGPRHSGMRAGGDPRRRQGRLSAVARHR